MDMDGNVESPGHQISITVSGDAPTTAGALDWDETWSGTVELDGDVVVPEGVTLTIQPGTTIRFPAGLDTTYSGADINKTEFVVHGTLLAEGTESEPIVFTSSSNTPAKGDWTGIKGDGKLYLEHVTVEYSGYGVQFTGNMDSDTLQVSACTVQHTSGDGITAYANSGATVQVYIEDSFISDNDRWGIYCNSSGANTVLDAGISGNTIEDNVSRAMYLYAQGDNNNPKLISWVFDNTISGHQDQGIYTYTRSGGISELTIDANTVTGSGIAVSCQYSSASAASVLSIRNNILNTQVDGIRISAASSSIAPAIEANKITGNSGYGVYLAVTQEPTVTGNELYGNALFDLYNNGTSDVDATGNWWGVDTTNEMNDGPYPKDIGAIFDNYDDGSKGTVSYDNWITAYSVPADPGLDTLTSPTDVASQTLTGTKDAGTAIVLNGAVVVPEDSATTWSHEMPLVEGNNPVALYARNAEGLTSSVVTRAIILDTTPPQILSSVPAEGSILNRTLQSIEITLFEENTAIDDTATLAGADIRDGGGAGVSGTWTLDNNTAVFMPDAPMGEGDYTVTLHPTDTPLGNSRVSTIHFSIDLTAPATPTLDPVTDPTHVAVQTISGGKEAGTAIWLDDAEIVPADELNTWSYDLSLSFEGPNSHALSALDTAGNRSGNLAFTIVLDRVPPAFQDSSPQDGSYVSAQPAAISFMFLDQTTGIDETASIATGEVQDGAAQAVDGSWSLTPPGTLVFTPATPLAEGSYTATIQAIDPAGNATGKTISFTYDATAPAVPTLNPVQSPTHLDHQTISGTKEAGTALWINGTEVLPFSTDTEWSFEYTLAEGENVLAIVSRDRAGNESSAVTATIVYDDVSPLPVALTANGNGVGTTVLLDWSGYDEAGQEDVAFYHIYMDTALFTQVGGMTPVTTLPAGTFTDTVTGLETGTTYWFAVVAEDENGNALTSVTPVSAVPTDTVPPVFSGLDWIDVDVSEAVSEGDQYVFHFSEAMDTSVIQDGTTHANIHLVPAGNTLYGALNTVSWSPDGRDCTVTVTAGYTIVGDEIVTPSSSVTDLAGNPVTGTQQLKGAPVIAPDIVSIRFNDSDGNGSVSVGDWYVFTFDEPIEPGSLSNGTTEANLNLPPQGKKYGTINTIIWNTDFTEVTIEITPGFTIVGNEVVDPSNQVTDVDGNPVENTGTLNLTDVIAPEVRDVQPLYINPVSATSNYNLTIQFNSAMDPTEEPVVTLTSSGAISPVVPTGGQWLTTRYPNDTYTTPDIVLSQGMDGTLTADVRGARDKAGNIMVPAPNIFSAVLDATPPANPAVIVSSVDCESATLSWDGYAAPEDLAGFQIYLTTEGSLTTVDGSSFVQQIGPQMRSFEIGPLTPEITYYAAVAALDNVGNFTPAVTSVPIFIARPVPPAAGITVEAGNNPDEAVISWSAYDTDGLCGFAGFKVFMEEEDFTTVDGLTPIATLDETARGHMVSGLDRARTYYFAVVGYNQADQFTADVTTASWSDPYTGDISTDTSIGAGDQKHIVINQTITVTSGATLTVEPGTTLYFAPGTGIHIQTGALIADGTAIHPIVFTSQQDLSDGTPAPGDWEGITLGSGNTGSVLRHVFVNYGQGLHIEATAPIVEAFSALSNSGAGLLVSNGGELTTSEALLQYNETGAAIENGGRLTITGSVIKYNTTNAASDNTETLEAQGNWWGSADATTIESTLIGDVDYDDLLTPFLTEEPVLVPAMDTADSEIQVGSRQIELVLACRNAEEMRISEDSAFSNVFFEPFQTNKPFTLSEGGGTKTIYAQFRSPTGTECPPISVQVTYVTEGPVITAFNLAEGQQIHRPVDVQAEATAALGLSALAFHVDGEEQIRTHNQALTYRWDVRQAENGIHRIKLLAEDLAGNVSTLELNVLVDLEPPAAPVITQPAAGLVLTSGPVTIRGTAEPLTAVRVSSNGFVVGTPTADANGLFEVADVSLTEGANVFVATAEDTVGMSADSNTVTVVLDSGPPTAPVLVGATLNGLGGVQLQWEYPETGEHPTIFRIYRHASPFIDTAQATLLADNISLLRYTDTSIPEGTYYYGLVGVDDAGNTSPLSNLVHIVYDSTKPSFTVSYGKTPPVGTGPLDITLTTDEALAAAPSLVITPSGAISPISVGLTRQNVNTYTGTFEILGSTPSGPAEVYVSGRDEAGNVFSGEPSGPTLVIDSQGPSGTIDTTPAQPVQVLGTTNVGITLTLDEPADSGSTPVLQFSPPSGPPVNVTLTGSGTAWTGSLTLEPAMVSGTGFGQFSLQCEDDLGNEGTSITAGSTLEIYDSPLPLPTDPPDNMTASSLPGGEVFLSWDANDQADSYNLYRKSGICDASPSEAISMNLTDTHFTDLPPADGIYCYGVTANRKGAESDLSSRVAILSDRTPPAAPANVSVSLERDRVLLTWDRPSSGDAPNGYSIYRNGEKIRTVTGSGGSFQAVDYPQTGGSYEYVVASFDDTGNETPAPPQSLQLLVGAVDNLQALVSNINPPLLTWESSDPEAVSFNVYRGGHKLNDTPLTEPSYEDVFYAGQSYLEYEVTAVNGNGDESPARKIGISPIHIHAVVNPNEEGYTRPLVTNYFNIIDVVITNDDTEEPFLFNRVENRITRNGEQIFLADEEAPFVVAPGSSVTDTITVPLGKEIEDHLLRVTLTQEQEPGSRVVYQNHIILADFVFSGDTVEMTMDDLPLAGGYSTVHLCINNSGYTDMDIVVYRDDGREHGDIYVALLNEDGLEISRAYYSESPPGVHDDSGTGYVTIAAGESLCVDVEVLVPAGLEEGTSLTFTGFIEQFFHDLSGQGQAGSGALTGSTTSQITFSPYYGVAQADRDVYTGDEAITITGQSINRDTGLPEPDAPLKIGFYLRG
ncbi:MAG: hypothetical protein DRH37_01180, partial [Deltaproteobacteria bacterium]